MPSVQQKVLLVDDSLDIHGLLDKMLSSPSLALLHAHGGQEGLDCALREKPNLILLDYMMPDIDGLTILKQMRNDPNLASLSTTPVILITAHDSPAFITQAFAAGAVDYIRKPVNIAELQVRVASCLRSQALVKDLYRRVMFDELTGLPNRAFLSDQVTDCIRKSQRVPEEQFALVLLDFDRFKLVNDSLGHHTGNQLLKLASQRLLESTHAMSQTDKAFRQVTVARLGGDEFAILLTGLSSKRKVEDFAEQLVDRLAEKYTIDNRVLYLNASVGVVHGNPRYKHSDDLLRDADTAMYAAKAAGRGCARIFDHSMRLRAESLLQLDSDLRLAIEKRQFLLLFQPILDLNSGTVSSVEALVRWSHPQRGWISPMEFIPVAEESGMIVELGEWILQEACFQLARWKANDPANAPPNVNVNVARLQLLQPGFTELVQDTIRRSGINGSNLTLEVTESGVMTDLNRSVQTLEELRDLGCQIHLDDFGTGYSSLSCLYELPIDALKLDRSLVSNLSGKQCMSSLITFVLQLAKSMNFRVVAEGIESLEQAQTLARWGCDYGQGYYFAKPLLQESIPAFVAGARNVWYAESQSCKEKSANAPFVPDMVPTSTTGSPVPIAI